MDAFVSSLIEGFFNVTTFFTPLGTIVSLIGIVVLYFLGYRLIVRYLRKLVP